MKWPVIVYFAILFLGACSFLFNKKNLPESTKYFFCLLLGVLITESIGFYLVYSKVKNYYWPYHFFAPISYLLFVLAYKDQFFWKRFKKPLLISIFAFFLLSLTFSITKNFNGPTSFITTVQNLLFIIITILYHNDMTSKKLNDNLFRQPVFWISIAYLIFCAGTFFSMALLSYLKNNYPYLVKKYFSINYALSYILYCFYIIAFLCSRTEKKLA
jgi:hypothetical protein